MSIYLIIAILLANIISILMVYQFIKKLEKKQILIFIAVSVAFMYILISMVYWISGFGKDETIHQATKDFVVYLFVPVNVILTVPYFALQYMKLRQKQIKIEVFVKKVSGLIILLCMILVVEYFYFCRIQTNIKNINTNINQAEKQNTLETNSMENHEEMSNEMHNNETIENKMANALE